MKTDAQNVYLIVKQYVSKHLKNSSQVLLSLQIAWDTGMYHLIVFVKSLCCSECEPEYYIPYICAHDLFHNFLVGLSINFDS